MKQGITMRCRILITLIFVSGITLGQATLNVGNDAPDLKIYKWLKKQPVKKFKNGQVYVVEFGATWCVPCRQMIPHLTDIARQYKGRVEVVSVFAMEDIAVKPGDKRPAYVQTIEKFVKKNDAQMDFTIGIDGPDRNMENSWLRAAGKEGIPYSFVIDGAGKIAWIGTGSTALREALQQVTSDSYRLDSMVAVNNRKLAQEVKYDHKKPLLIDGNGGSDTGFIFRSILIQADGKVRGPQSSFIHSPYWIKGTEVESLFGYHLGQFQTDNATIADLYFVAYGDTSWNFVPRRNIRDIFGDTLTKPWFRRSYGRYWYEPVLEVADSSPFQTVRRSPVNRYHYSLKVNVEPYPSAAWMQQIMRNDLNSYFGYDVRVETRPMLCWKLTVLDSAKIKTALLTKTPGLKYKSVDDSDPFLFTNAVTADIISTLGAFYGYKISDYGKLSKSEQGPFVDETGIKDEIDFIYNKNWSMQEMIDYLASVGIRLSKGQKEMKVVVIRDSKE